MLESLALGPCHRQLRHIAGVELDGLAVGAQGPTGGLLSSGPRI
jgi:hypothetical protein